MKKNYLWGICAVMALSSCSQDDVVSVPQTSINYSVVTNKASRAQDLFCNNNKPASFNVSAYYNAPTSGTELSGQYFDGDQVNVSGTTVTPVMNRYWPEEGTLDFYAYVNAGNTYKFRNAEASNQTQFVDFTINKTVSDQVDLLYAVAKGQTEADAPVKLNFRHALSQIVFQARNENPAIHVIVKGVGVGNVESKGTFTFPEQPTTENVEDHDQNGTFEIKNQGTWALEDDVLDAYAVTFEPTISLATPTLETSSTTNLTNNELLGDNEAGDATKYDFAKAMLLMPQVLQDPWDPTAAATDNGAYIELDCEIYNVSGTSYDSDKDIKLYDGKIRMPLGSTSTNETVEWKQGFKYVYTFVFTKQGNGGFDPDDGDPVLVPITYTITVDDFTNEENKDVIMDTNSDKNN